MNGERVFIMSTAELARKSGSWSFAVFVLLLFYGNIAGLTFLLSFLELLPVQTRRLHEY
jgi:antibiotic biosynthesis monooxygenase (ABM) superfamily enzyme